MTAYFTTSWDDGHPLDRKLADLMVRHRIAATFYCPRHNREGLPAMDAQALRALDGAFEIGSHTLEHAYADSMPARLWQRQVVDGKAWLEDTLGHAVEGFCYPGGKAGVSARETVLAAGFAYARTGENFRAEIGADPWLMPASLQFYPHSRQVLLGNFVRRGNWRQRYALTAACLAERDFERRLLAALKACRGQNAVFHLWGHSWELERHGLWPSLDRFLAVVAECVPFEARLTNAQVLRAKKLFA